MLVIQSGFKTDLESGAAIFVLYMCNNNMITYNCKIDYKLISEAKSAEEVTEALIPMIKNLCDVVFPENDTRVPLQEDGPELVKLQPAETHPAPHGAELLPCS